MNRSVLMGVVALIILGVAGFLTFGRGGDSDTHSEIPAEAKAVIESAGSARPEASSVAGRSAAQPDAGGTQRLDPPPTGDPAAEDLDAAVSQPAAGGDTQTSRARRRLPRRSRKPTAGESIEDVPTEEQDRKKPAGVVDDDT